MNSACRANIPPSETIPFRWVCRIAEGQVNPTTELWADLPLIAPNHIDPGTGRLIGRETAREQGAISGKYQFKPGTVLYSKIRPALAKVCIAPEKGLCSADMYPIVPDHRLLPKFLFWQLLSDRFTDWAILESMRVAMPKLNRETLGSFPLWVPETRTQERITAFLDRETARIDQLIEQKQAFILALEERDEGATRLLLSGRYSASDERKTTPIPWLQNVPEHWRVVPLRHLVRISTGSKDTQDKTDSGAYPFFVRSMNVERIDTYSYDEEAVLTSGDGAGVGKVFHHVTGKFELHQRMYAFTKFNGLSGRYFYHFLKAFFHHQMTQWSAKSTVDSVRMPFLKSMLFAVPPMSEQQDILAEIDTSLSRTSQILSATAASIQKLREFRAALISAAVTGQIDVTTWGKQGQTDRRLDRIEEEMTLREASA